MRPSTLAGLLLLSTSATIAAAPVTPTVAYFDPITGYEWASVTTLQGAAVEDVDAVCANSPRQTCVGVVDGVDLSGWRYASSQRVAKLLDNMRDDLTFAELMGDQALDLTGASAWAPVLVDTFGTTLSGSFMPGMCGGFDAEMTLGWTHPTVLWAGQFPMAGVVSIRDSEPGVCETLNSSDFVAIGTSLTVNAKGGSTGFWLYRTTVPEPGVVALFALAAGAVWHRRARRSRIET